MKKCINNVLFSVLIVLIAGFIALSLTNSIKPVVVVSGSMENEIHTGSLCIINCKDKDLKTSDIAGYKLENIIVVHRVVCKTSDGYITKGDANEFNDPAIVLQNQIVGKCILTIPLAGYIITFLKTKECIVFIITLLLIFLVGKKLFKKEEKDG